MLDRIFCINSDATICKKRRTKLDQRKKMNTTVIFAIMSVLKWITEIKKVAGNAF
jgi:hypothetical protein